MAQIYPAGTGSGQVRDRPGTGPQGSVGTVNRAAVAPGAMCHSSDSRWNSHGGSIELAMRPLDGSACPLPLPTPFQFHQFAGDCGRENWPIIVDFKGSSSLHSNLK